jgi:hypothetical protein
VDDLVLKSVQPASGSLEDGPGLTFDFPEGAEWERADPPAIMRLKACPNGYVFLNGLKARRARLSMIARVSDLQGSAAFGLCAAAQGQDQERVVQIVRFADRKHTAVRHLGALRIDGELEKRA